MVHKEPETFSLVIPEGPISALLGSSITLPCSVDPQFSVVSLKTTWYRPTKLNTPILQYENQKVQTDPSDALYRGRVSLVGQLDQGNVSMRLDKLTLEDGGEYVCYVQSNVWYEEATMSLVVEAVGSIPKLSSSKADGKQVNVSCVSDGWSPQPTVTWTGGGGEIITLHNVVYSTDDQGLVRVTSWLLRSASESESLSCSVGLSDQKKREGTILVHR
ncbi:butyrophilin subfamily 3 member A2-like, partial [Engraulis encrasicolus]|uniref:butyrophilin subfamily 3 member A2-like n=1 Tax=Engraulis encrasicolus TaxID=184585 RepID=UPI002FD07BBD